jgi:hypothetical protein
MHEIHRESFTTAIMEMEVEINRERLSPLIILKCQFSGN